MNFLRNKIWIFATAGGLYLIGQYFRGVWFLGTAIPNLCGNWYSGGEAFCNSPYLDSLGWPLILAGKILTVVGLILLVANERGYRAWRKFSLYYVPIAIFLILYFFPFRWLWAVAGYEQGVWDFFGELYLPITVAIVLWTRFFGKNKV